MSIMGQKPTARLTMNPNTAENPFCSNRPPAGGAAGPVSPARLQAIHELVRSGHYHVPATAIAERMIERLIAGRRGHTG